MRNRKGLIRLFMKPVRNHSVRRRPELNSSQIIIFGFLGVILAGTLLLMLPIATKNRQGASFTDALFTVTSATCVTGLVVQDTVTYWSLFGQAVLLILIQIGGMGIVTASLAVFLFSGKRISLRQRSTMRESISAAQVGGIVRLTGFILKTTIFLELLGAAVMTPVFVRDFGLARGIWYGLFHSVSAFCNGGFDLMGSRGAYSSLCSYVTQPVINVTIMLLIVLGGLGFSTWDDLRRARFRFRFCSMQTKTVLAVTFVLLLLPALYFFFFEFGKMPLPERIWSSLFQSVTMRTAGFNTVDYSLISEGGLVIMIFLMLVGGSPGSTAGGMKTTTLAVLAASAFSVFRRKDDAQLFHRRISPETIRNAVAILTLYLTCFLAGGIVISRLEGFPLLSCLFETASAIGTVGVSLGITRDLGTVSRLILVLMMFCGRVGGLTVVFATISPRAGSEARYPQENLIVG